MSQVITKHLQEISVKNHELYITFTLWL